jgi:hypothetical protein
VRVRSDRRYRFDVSPEGLWERISDVDEFCRWWPWLRGFEADELCAGEAWDCTVQPPLPYLLRFTIALEEVVPPRLVTACVTGDIVGDARLEVGAQDAGCVVRLQSDLAPGNRYLRAVASVARPLVRYGHDWVLDTGARQFSRRAL